MSAQGRAAGSSGLRRFLRHMLEVLSWFELHPRRILGATRAMWPFYREYRQFSAQTDWSVRSRPCLFDRNGDSAWLGEYFWQDLFVARELLEFRAGRPELRHLDVGSRMDGFIAHLVCTSKVDVLDIRPLEKRIEGVNFIQGDITQPRADLESYADCLTCLHTLEHIGLGRYGDRLDPEGWRAGLAGLARVLKPGGTLWLSVPIGAERVEFNAHRVFHPASITDAAQALGLVLECFYDVTAEGVVEVPTPALEFEALAAREYGLGIFRFRRRELAVPGPDGG